MSNKLFITMCLTVMLLVTGCREAKPGSSSAGAPWPGAIGHVSAGPRWLASRIVANDHALGSEVGCEGGFGESGRLRWGAEDVQMSELSWRFRKRVNDADVYEFRRMTALPCNTKASESSRPVVISELRQVYYFGNRITVLKDKFQEVILYPKEDR